MKGSTNHKYKFFVTVCTIFLILVTAPKISQAEDRVPRGFLSNIFSPLSKVFGSRKDDNRTSSAPPRLRDASRVPRPPKYPLYELPDIGLATPPPVPLTHPISQLDYDDGGMRDYMSNSEKKKFTRIDNYSRHSTKKKKSPKNPRQRLRNPRPTHAKPRPVKDQEKKQGFFTKLFKKSPFNFKSKNRRRHPGGLRPPAPAHSLETSLESSSQIVNIEQPVVAPEPKKPSKQQKFAHMKPGIHHPMASSIDKVAVSPALGRPLSYDEYMKSSSSKSFIDDPWNFDPLNKKTSESMNTAGLRYNYDPMQLHQLDFNKNSHLDINKLSYPGDIKLPHMYSLKDKKTPEQNFNRPHNYHYHNPDPPRDNRESNNNFRPRAPPPRDLPPPRFDNGDNNKNYWNPDDRNSQDSQNRAYSSREEHFQQSNSRENYAPEDQKSETIEFTIETDGPVFMEPPSEKASWNSDF